MINFMWGYFSGIAISVIILLLICYLIIKEEAKRGQ